MLIVVVLVTWCRFKYPNDLVDVLPFSKEEEEANKRKEVVVKHVLQVKGRRRRR